MNSMANCSTCLAFTGSCLLQLAVSLVHLSSLVHLLSSSLRFSSLYFFSSLDCAIKYAFSTPPLPCVCLFLFALLVLKEDII